MPKLSFDELIQACNNYCMKKEPVEKQEDTDLPTIPELPFIFDEGERLYEDLELGDETEAILHELMGMHDPFDEVKGG